MTLFLKFHHHRAAPGERLISALVDSDKKRALPGLGFLPCGFKMFHWRKKEKEGEVCFPPTMSTSKLILGLARARKAKINRAGIFQPKEPHLAELKLTRPPDRVLKRNRYEL